jgi:RsiW-degrading membrane proteinase PrsW (M82 family)
MLETMLTYLKSWFVYPDLPWSYLLAGIGLALVFGALWLSAHWPPLLRRPWLWVVAVVEALLSVVAITFVQIPLQSWAHQAMVSIWGEGEVIAWMTLAGVPLVLVSGLVQEGAKMVPMAFWWWRQDRNISPKQGLAIGALAGAGLGIFEALRAHCLILGAGWTLSALQTDGFLAVAGFWERFFAIGFHIAVSALAGYGLAKGKGWQCYLIASVLHALVNYGAVLLQSGIFALVALETYVAVIAVLLSAAVLLIRWRRSEEDEEVII